MRARSIGLALSAVLLSQSAVVNGVLGADSQGLSETCKPRFEGSTAIVLDCQPGYATAHDTIEIHPRGGVDPGADPGSQVDQTNAVWLFHPGGSARVALLIDFHSNTAGMRVADLYDDGDGNNTVDYSAAGGIPVPLEHGGRWTVRVTAREPAWVVSGRPSSNLDLSVDGPVRASYGSAQFVGQLRNDGKADFEIHVRDTRGDGNPDLEWTQFDPPLSDDPRQSGHVRTEIIENTEGDEIPMSGGLFWPYLAQQPNLQASGRYAKLPGESAPPIEVDWTTARVVQVGEFVASRANPGNYFIYSINRVVENATTSANFENPFAFYDLAGADDGWPDMSIRFKTTLMNEVLTPRPNANPINIVELSWDQQHDHDWTYALNLVGHQSVTDITRYPDFEVRTIPPSVLPAWVATQEWDAATFVEAPSGHTAPEGIDEFSVEQGDSVLPLRYLTGLDPSPPVEQFSQIPAGFRGEYAFDLLGRTARLYLSPIDRRLHLLDADGGTWNLGAGHELRYESLSGPYIDHWVAIRDGDVSADLWVLGDQAMYASPRGLTVGTLRDRGSPSTFAPPTDHEAWAELADLLRRNTPAFVPDDVGTMFSRSVTSVASLPGASITEVRPAPDGFRFILSLRDSPLNAPWAAGKKPGDYAVHYRQGRGYVVDPVTPAAYSITAVDVDDAPRALQPIQVSASIRNNGGTDGDDVNVTFYAGRDPAQLERIGSTVVEVLADAPAVRAETTWTPPGGGDWVMQARVDEADAAGPIRVVQLLPSDDLDPVSIVAAEDVPPNFIAAALFLLAVGIILAVSIGLSVISRRLTSSGRTPDRDAAYIVERSSSGVQRRSVAVVKAARAGRVIRRPGSRQR